MTECSSTITPIPASAGKMLADGARLMLAGLTLAVLQLTDTVLDRVDDWRTWRKLQSLDEMARKDIGLSYHMDREEFFHGAHRFRLSHRRLRK